MAWVASWHNQMMFWYHKLYTEIYLKILPIFIADIKNKKKDKTAD